MRGRSFIKYLVIFALIVCMTASMSLPVFAGYFEKIYREDTTVYVNGEKMVFLAYSIGNRYVKIRDIAYALSGTSKQFDVSWSASRNAIVLTSGVMYNVVGGEMERRSELSGIARLSGSKFLVDNEEISITGYSIGGATFFRLRDVGKAMDFSVIWDEARKAIVIDTSKNYPIVDDSADSDGFVFRKIDPSKPMVALTFDDGPSQYTSKILDVLENNNSAATFFILGSRASGYGATIRRAYNMGCEIGGHSWSHRNLTGLPESSIRSEINNTNSTIRSYTGATPMVFRAPYGSVNDRVRSAAKSCLTPIYAWSMDTRDWANRNSSYVYSYIMRNVKNKDIILCHDIHGTTAEAMKRVIPDLVSRGYQLVTVSELMYYSGKTPEAGRVYSSGR